MADDKKLGTFEVEIDGKTVELAVIQQTAQVAQNASLEYNKTFSASVKSGSLLRIQLENYLSKEDIWTEEKAKRYDEILDLIGKHEQTLAKGGIKLSQAREAAIELRILRSSLRDLISERTELESNTAEGQSENARFNYIIANTVVYSDTEEKYFNGVEGYLNSATTQQTIEIASKAAEILYGLGDTYEKGLPENQFLLKYKLANDELHLIDKEGNLCDMSFNRIDDEGYRLDEEGNRIDVQGKPLDQSGNYDYGEDFTDFVDDIWEEKKTKKRGRPKKTVEAKAETQSEPEEASVDS